MTTKIARGVALAAVIWGTGCSLDGLLNSDELPPTVSDPATLQTPAGARAAYHGTLSVFYAAFGARAISNTVDGWSDASFVARTGLLTDELFTGSADGFDADDARRIESSGMANTYATLQKVRGQAGQAIGLLTQYLPDQPALPGHLYAVQGYAEVFLAELFCSGIPLSTLDYAGDFTYRPGSTTEEVLAHAIALFDTALTLAGDTARFVDLARIGRARALSGLGAYAAAAAAVAPVADAYRYDAPYNGVPNATGAVAPSQNFAFTETTGTTGWFATVPDREGVNGMDWRTSNDPRTRTTLRIGHYHPNKYNVNGSSPIVLASGVEARLLEAEAQLQADPDGGTWLATLNALRTDGTQDGGGVYNPGTGGTAGLAPLADPGTAAARVDLLFRERAFWLFLTGHRQGDLRRLIRQYQRSPGDIYPVGPYPGKPLPYGSDVTAPIPETEFANPLFTGCVSRDA